MAVATSSLTPAMSRLSSTCPSPSSGLAAAPDASLREEDTAQSTGNIRQLIQDCLDKQLYSTAIFYAERLCSLPGSCTSDQVMFAKCFHYSGEYRRCLVALEHRGLLGADVIGPISETLRPSRDSLTNQEPRFLTPGQHSELSGLYLAADCLLRLEEWEDCVTLLEALLAVDDEGVGVAERVIAVIPNRPNAVHIMAGIYTKAGRCFDMLENRPRSLRALTMALRIDPACTEAAEYISSRGLMSQREQRSLLQDVLECDEVGGRAWLKPYYSFLLEDGVPDMVAESGNDEGGGLRSALSLIQQAEYSYARNQQEEAYRLARQAYTIDPFDWRGNLIYIATLVDLQLKTELFYLGHELAHTHPKLAVSWYAVACYYWTCQKLEPAQKYLQKATKIDKRFSNAWILLGHVLAAQEESEHAISAYRTACRILPGDHKPKVFMAKELVRTSNFSLALHVLSEALVLCPQDPSILNELGVVHMQLNRLDDGLRSLRQAAEEVLRGAASGSNRRNSTTGSVEILSNYATCLRKCGMLENALEWYQQCLAFRPMDPMTHANIGFTLHLARRFDEAVEEYHRALSLQPGLSFCADMLSQCLQDMRIYQCENAPARSDSAQSRLNALFPTEVIGPDPSLSQSLVDDVNEQPSESSFYIHSDRVEDRSLFGADVSYSGIYASPGESSRGVNDTMTDGSRPYTDQGFGSRGNRSESFVEDDFDDSVESYSRIAGRLSLDSTMSNGSS